MKEIHKPVMVDEVLRFMALKPGQVVIDATAGLGGHTKAIWERVAPDGIVIAVEKDLESLRFARERVEGDGVVFIHESYTNLGKITEFLGIKGKVDAILFDLGISSYLLEHSGRGFSFKQDEYLDMRFNPEEGLPADHYINRMTAPQLEHIFRNYGEIRFARSIAESIVKHRKRQRIKTTGMLNEIVLNSVPGIYRRNQKLKKKLLAQVYQALRIQVNKELESIATGLVEGLKVLKEEGRMVVISYHSLEDRLVKQLKKMRGVEALLKKPLTPGNDELSYNPRSRSARLRAYKKMGELNEEDIDHFTRLEWDNIGHNRPRFAYAVGKG